MEHARFAVATAPRRRLAVPLRVLLLVRMMVPLRVPLLALTLARMRVRLLALLLAGAAGLAGILATTPANAQSARYEIDPEHFSVGFLVDHIGYAKVLGLFRTARGSYQFDEKTGALTDVRIEVETASVFTNHRKRDDHLKGPDFLNSGEFPKMVFTASQAERKGERDFIVKGQLDLIGKTRPVTLALHWNKSSAYELANFNKPYVMGVSGRGSFKRSEFGMMYAVENKWVGDEIELMVEFEARRQ